MILSTSDSTWVKPTLLTVGLLFAATLWAYLGGGLFLLAHHHHFGEATPLTLYQYWAYYGEQKSVQNWLFVCSLAAAFVVVAPIAWLFAPAKRSLFGDARFATLKEVKDAGLLSAKKGIIVGLFMGRYLVFGGSQHALMSAPTRGGKGVGVVIPNLLTWPDSAVILDMKLENHAITSKYRAKHGQACFLFNPTATDYRTHRYNPLFYISDDPHFRIDDIQKIASMLYPDVPNTDPIWTATPRTLFLGITLYLLETPGKAVTIGQVLRESLVDGDGVQHFARIISARALGERIPQASATEAHQQAEKHLRALLSDKAKAIESHPVLTDMAIWCHLSVRYRTRVRRRVAVLRKRDAKTPDIMTAVLDAPFDRESAELRRALSPACVRALNAYTSIKSDNTRSGIITTFRSRLELWNNPLVDAATSANDFDLRDLRKKRMTIYVGVTPDNLERLSSLLLLFWQQTIDLNIRELPERNPALKYQVLVLPDEFTAPGKLPVLAKGISFLAGYGIRLLPIIQSPSQLVETYGEHAARTFKQNHALQIVFPPKATDTDVAEEISKWLGNQTVKGVSESKSKKLLSRREATENVSDQRRPLMWPQEITGLGQQRELVVVENCPPILARKIQFFKDHTFMDRLKSVSPSLAAYGRKLPKTKEELDKIVLAGELAAHVPALDIEAHLASIEAQPAPLVATAGSFDADHTEVSEVVIVERTATAADVPQLDKFSLANFAVDFSAVESPGLGDLDEVALLAYADSLCREAGITV
jgi:type IV secretion system protein VirD4